MRHEIPNAHPAATTPWSLPIKKIRRAIPALQGVMVAAFIILFLLMLSPRMFGATAALTRVAAAAMKIIWVVWFPLTLASVIIAGRAWCGVLCPMGALSEAAGRRGFRQRLPDWLRSPATPIASFLLITVVAQVFSVRGNPVATATLFGGVMLLAIAVGFLYGRSHKRPWCRHACPIGLLLGLFGRLGMVDFRLPASNPKTGEEAYAERGPCPTMIKLPSKTSARHCIECLRCVGTGRTSAEQAGGLEIAWRSPGDEIERIGQRGADPWEVGGLFLGAGVALGGFLWLVLPHYLLLRWWLQIPLQAESWPLWFMRWPTFPWLVRHLPSQETLDALAIIGFMLLCTFVVAGALYALTFLSAFLAGQKTSPKGTSRFGMINQLGYQFAPMALVSLLLGLGSRLLDIFSPGLRMGLLALAGVWSLWLGWRILSGLAVPVLRRTAAMLPGLAGVLLLAVLWSPALDAANPQVEKITHMGMPIFESGVLPHRSKSATGGY